jgi:three-Cys-motif partner protein
MALYRDENPGYWEDYSQIQHVKHSLLQRYLGGWFPILSRWHGRVVYIDTHAGRGKHAAGQEGSPLAALEVLIRHRFLPQILSNAEVLFLFIERDTANKEELERNLARIAVPAKIHVDVVCEDFSNVIQDQIDYLVSNNLQMAPAFVFVDPYGFKLSMNLLSQLKAFNRCELFVTFMWRYIDMAINLPAQEKNMDALFGCPEWRALRDIERADQRCEAAIQLFQKQLGARYVTWTKMLGENRTVTYVLIHATNHEKGRELMKEAVWAVLPEGTFAARVSDDPNQEFLIRPEPDLTPLTEWLWRRYRGHDVRYSEIRNELISTIFLPKHLNRTIRTLRDNGEIQLSGYIGRFSFEQDPIIGFHEEVRKGGKR